MPRTEEEIIVGRVVGPFGIKGDVKVVVLTDFPERFKAGNELTVKLPGGMQARKIERSRFHKEMFLLKLSGIDDRNAAEEMRGASLVIPSSRLAELEPGRFYIFDIIGLKVATEDGRDLGVVTEVLQGGANDVYFTSIGLCIPALKHVVMKVDIKAGFMVIRPIPGMLPDDQDAD